MTGRWPRKIVQPPQHVSAACLDGNLLFATDLDPLKGTSPPRLRSFLQANVCLHFHLSRLNVLSSPPGEGMRSVCLGANTVDGRMRGHVLLRNGPQASRKGHTACTGVMQRGIPRGLVNVHVGSAARTEIAQKLYKN